MKIDAYKDAGVDIAAGDKAVDLIKEKVQKTFRHYDGKILTNIGGFSGLAEMPDGRIIGMATDGVGTKLMIAIAMSQNGTVGQDLVAMCVNDLMVAGVIPTFYLDYMAMGKQIPEKTDIVINGIIEGCELAECALVGGEMAEMPGMYGIDDYDLAGLAIGFADSKDKLVLGKNITPGMKVYGLPSSGVHSNGYSLIRKIFQLDLEKPDEAKIILDTVYPGLNRPLGAELLEPTIIYVKIIKELMNKYQIAGMAHITGGGLIENPPRILPEGCSITIDTKAWKRPAIFDLIQSEGIVSDENMHTTFNCGIGLILVSANNISEAIEIGEVIKGNKEVIIN